ncbi:SAM-dependent methyltransferase [Streptomyces niveus]|uniref:SAM-dependent methyltransferase n=1 Tax=Streptomyces niveus TaxID=193462 RepID=UPI0036BD7E22
MDGVYAELLDLMAGIAGIAGGGVGTGRVTDWLARATGARVDIVRPGDVNLPPVLRGHETVVTALRGQAGGPDGEQPGRELKADGTWVRLVPAPGPAPRTLLVAVRASRWTAEEVALLGRSAVAVARLDREADISGRELRLTQAAMGARVSGLQHLMLGDLARAGRALEPLVPGLVAAGAGQVAVVECGRREDRRTLAVEVDRALAWQALTVMCPVDHRQVIVVHPTGRGVALHDVLAPVVERAPGRACGVSHITPWPRTGAAYEAAVSALNPARATGTVTLDDGRAPLVEQLGADARIWSALLLQELDGLPARAELLETTRAVLHWGETDAAPLLGWSRDTLARRMETLAEATGLDRGDPWQRTALYLAVRLDVLPPPAVLDRSVTLDDVLDHPSARAWADAVLDPLPPALRRTLAAWVSSAGEPDAAAAELGIARSTLYRRLARVSALTRLEVTRYPGPYAEMLLALHVAGDVRMGSLPVPGGRPAPRAVRETATVDEMQIDTSKPHPARVYASFLGSDIHFAADREAAKRILEKAPHTAVGGQQNRAFMHRAVRTLAAEHGVRQFLDLGSGIPISPNLHEVVQDVAPDARVVYVDSDPIVLAYADALLTGPEGSTGYIQADIRNVDALYAHRGLHRVLDLEQPVALSLLALLHFVPGEDAYTLVASLRERLAPGSYLAITHLTPDFAPKMINELVESYSRTVTPGQARTRSEVEGFFDGAELLDPGVVCLPHWRPDPSRDVPPDDHVNTYGAVARLL